MKTYVIAEAGVNHNGSLDLARKLIDAAAEAGADAVKFQSFRAASLVIETAPKADYQLQTTGNAEGQFEMIRKLELSEPDHIALSEHCATRGIEFLSTPFDSTSLDMLISRFGMKTIKISSGDLTNAPFLLEVSRKAQRVILSTGMSTLAEIEDALGVLAFGFTSELDQCPGSDSFDLAFSSEEGQLALRERVSILHCTTEYPAPVDEVNLRAMDTIAHAFGTVVGYSDHTRGTHIPIAAVARGAQIIEKHFTLNRDMPGPDHKASLEPDELKSMILAIREVEACLGDGVKRPTASELKNRTIARKSLVAAMAVPKGNPLSLEIKRPGSGLSPFHFWTYQNRAADRDYAKDDLIHG